MELVLIPLLLVVATALAHAIPKLEAAYAPAGGWRHPLMTPVGPIPVVHVETLASVPVVAAAPASDFLDLDVTVDEWPAWHLAGFDDVDGDELEVLRIAAPTSIVERNAKAWAYILGGPLGATDYEEMLTR